MKTKYVNQKNERDCLQATLANLLNVDYETIPKFYLKYEVDENQWAKELDDYLGSLNYYRILFDVSFKNNILRSPLYCGLDKLLCMGVLKKEKRKFSHVVLFEMANKEGEVIFTIIHDPKPNSDYDIIDLIKVELILQKPNQLVVLTTLIEVIGIQTPSAVAFLKDNCTYVAKKYWIYEGFMKRLEDDGVDYKIVSEGVVPFLGGFTTKELIGIWRNKS